MLVRRSVAAAVLAVSLLAVPATAAGAAPKPPVPTTVKPVTPGAFCAPAGATGRDKTGRAMRCIALKGEKQPRWRAA